MKAIRISLISSFGFALLFGLPSLLFYFGDWKRILIVTLFGVFTGFVAAPEIEPKAFKTAWLVQLIGGLFSGGIIGWLFLSSPDKIGVSIVCGGIVGWLAPFWVKHVQIP